MDSYTLIWVRDAKSRPVQFSIPKLRIKQFGIGAAVIALLGLVAVWDYWRLRADNAELADLRVEAFEQREEITPAVGNTYYLVVPMTMEDEGVYGSNSAGKPRPPARFTCRAGHAIASCP